MKGWIILAAVLAVLFLIGQIPVGVRGEYSADGPFAWVRLGWLKLQVFPLKKKDKPKKPRKKKAKKSGQKKGGEAGETPAKTPLPEKIGGALDYAHSLLPIVLEAAGCFWNKLRMDHLELELTVGGSDPGDIALRYGQANAALGAFWYALTDAFHVEDGSARVRVDFDAPGMTLYGAASLSIKIGQALWLGVCYGIKALMAFLKVRKRQKVKKQERKAA